MRDTLTLELPMTPETDGRGGDSCPALCSAFRTIVADPPWDVKRGAPQGRPAGVQLASQPLPYPTMTVEEICALPIGKMADENAHLYIWTINKYVEDTYRVARAWGFQPSTLLYWFKEPKGIGLGGTYATCVEPILFCRRGTLAAKKRCDRNWWTWPRGEHSAKPPGFQTVVEEHSPGPYLEIFARRKRHGWASWGNEIANDVEMPNDPSSATASAARVERTVRSRTPATLERTAGRPFAAAHG